MCDASRFRWFCNDFLSSFFYTADLMHERIQTTTLQFQKNEEFRFLRHWTDPSVYFRDKTWSRYEGHKQFMGQWGQELRFTLASMMFVVAICSHCSFGLPDEHSDPFGVIPIGRIPGGKCLREKWPARRRRQHGKCVLQIVMCRPGSHAKS